MRRFYGFGSVETLEEHISEIKTIEDLFQLSSDIRQSETNLAKYYPSSVPGVYEIQCLARVKDTQRYLFLTNAAFVKLGGLTESEKFHFKKVIIFDAP